MTRETRAASERPRRPGARAPFTQAGGLLFFGAVRGHDRRSRAPGEDTRTLSDDTRQQARQAFANLKGLLAEAGATLDDVVHVTVYLQDLKYSDPFSEVWTQHFPDRAPARIMVQVANASAHEREEQAHFAMDVIAAAP